MSWCSCGCPRVEHDQDKRCQGCLYDCNLYEPNGRLDVIKDAINWIFDHFDNLEKPRRPKGW